MASDQNTSELKVGSPEWELHVDAGIKALTNSMFNAAGRVIVLEAAVGVLAAKLAELQPQSDKVIDGYLAIAREMVSNLPGLKDRDGAMMTFDIQNHLENIGVTIRSALGAMPPDEEKPVSN